MDILTEERCLERGCVYAESVTPDVPWCFVPQTDFGFAVVEGPIPTLLGERWLLRRKNIWAVYQENFENITFSIEMRENNVLRFKVSLYWFIAVHTDFERSYKIVRYQQNVSKDHTVSHRALTTFELSLSLSLSNNIYIYIYI